MEAVAKFERVTPTRFHADYVLAHKGPQTDEQEIADLYYAIRLPRRATSGSAGYDINTPVPITLAPGQSVVVPTGLRCRIAKGWVMQLFPRSSLGFLYGMRLANTVGIIDSDYYGAHNEGHIMIKVTLTATHPGSVELEAGSRIAQAVFVPFGITENDDPLDAIRTGGIGSTGQ